MESKADHPRVFIGIDGGGTKTAYALVSADRRYQATWTGGTVSYRALGSVSESIDALKAGIERTAACAGLGLPTLAGVAAGMACYGENADADAALDAAFRDAFPGVPFRFCNDVEVGYRGALGDRAGIHLVSGTGSIAFGRDQTGASARCGGWSEYFSDEGSCYWLGLQCMNLFTRQADGREPRGPLYALVQTHFAETDDFRVCTAMEACVHSGRSETAALQRLLLAAAQMGDTGAKRLYADAAAELCRLAQGVKKSLHYADRPIPVSLSGGLKHAGGLLLPELQRLLETDDMHLVEAENEPVQGALALCLRLYEKGDVYEA